MVGEGDPAHFECAVSANPLTAETIRWERKNYDMLSRTVTTPGAPKDQTHYFQKDQVRNLNHDQHYCIVYWGATKVMFFEEQNIFLWISVLYFDQ